MTIKICFMCNKNPATSFYDSCSDCYSTILDKIHGVSTKSSPILTTNEQVLFASASADSSFAIIDSHGCGNFENGTFTIPVTGNYIYVDEYGTVCPDDSFLAGHVLEFLPKLLVRRGF